MTTATLQSANRRKHALLMALSGCLLAGALSVARANPPNADVLSVTVNYGDLNLTTDRGTTELYRRIAAAARQVCARDDLRGLAFVAAARACEAQAIARAVDRVDSPQLAAVYAARSKHG